MAPELAAALGEPFRLLWTRLEREQGAQERARTFARLLRSVDEHGDERVREVLEQALASGTFDELTVQRLLAAAQPSAAVTVPETLRGYEVERARRQPADGPIPAELGNLTNLKWLALSRNELTAPIPAELGDLSNLISLSLGSNQLTGCVPVGLRDVASNDLLVPAGELAAGMQGRHALGTPASARWCWRRTRRGRAPCDPRGVPREVAIEARGPGRPADTVRDRTSAEPAKHWVREIRRLRTDALECRQGVTWRSAYPSAAARSNWAWRFIQNSGSTPNQCPNRSAVSPVTERLPAMIWLTRLGGTLIWRADADGLTPNSSSSLRTSPG